MTRRRALAVAVVIALLAGAVAVIVARRGGNDDGARLAARDPARKVTRLAAVKATASSSSASSPADGWLIESGATPSRIAGVVLDGDTPASGARVVLQSGVIAMSGEDPPVAITGADGRFDFGPRPAAAHVVGAALGATRRADVEVDLRDPLLDPAADQLVLRLEACATIERGRVRDVDGQPVATAVITTIKRIDFVFEPLFDVPVAPDGTFEVCGKGIVVARAPGYASVWIGAAPASGRWDLVMYEEAVVEGTVTLQGEPVAGAHVVLLSEGLFGGGGLRAPPLSLVGWSSADGTFRITGVTPGTHRVGVDAARGGTLNWPYVHARAGQAVTGVRVELEPLCARVVAGVVLEDDRPVPSATVDVGRRVRTQLDGTFVAPCVGAEEVEISVRDYEVERPTIPAGTADIDDLVVRVRRDDSRASIAGRVTAGGQPVAGAEVTLGEPRRSGEGRYRGRATTDADGRFTLTRLPANEYPLHARDPRDGRRSRPQTIVVERGRDVGVELVLDVAGAIDGVVIDHDGRPFANVGVHVTGDIAPDPLVAGRARSRSTGADGRFTIGGLSAGTYELCVGPCRGPRDPGLPPAEGEAWQPVVLATDDARVTVRLAVRARQGLSIRGRVVDDQGAPVAHAVVSALRHETTAGADGRFELTGLVEGAHHLRARGPDGHGGAREGVAAGSTDVDIVASRTASLRITVRGGTGDCSVTASAPRDSGGRFRIARGRDLTFDGLAPAPYDLTARCGDVAGRAQVQLGAAEDRAVEVTVGATGTVRARVRTADGAEVAGAQCTFPQAGELPGAAQATAGPDGVVTFAGVARGTAQLLCGTSDGQLYGEASVDVVPGGSADVDVTLTPLKPR